MFKKKKRSKDYLSSDDLKIVGVFPKAKIIFT